MQTVLSHENHDVGFFAVDIQSQEMSNFDIICGLSERHRR